MKPLVQIQLGEQGYVEKVAEPILEIGEEIRVGSSPTTPRRDVIGNISGSWPEAVSSSLTAAS